MNWLKITAALLLLGAALVWAAEPPNVEGPKLRVNATAFMYKPITDAAASASTGTWTVDSGATDTSNAYQIVPGVYAAFSGVLSSAADTVDEIYVDISLNGSNWVVYDTMSDLNGTTATYDLIKKDTISAGSVPIIGRYLRFRVVNHDGDTLTDGSTITAYLVTTPAPGL
jgi:hypothetical protein